MCLCAQVACQKKLHMEDQPRARHLWQVSVSASWCRTQVSEKLSWAGSTVTCILRLFQSPHNSICTQTRQENKVVFNINRLDVVSPLFTFSLTPNTSFSTPTCPSMLLNPWATFQPSFYLPCHSPLFESKPCLLGFQDTHQSLLLRLLPHSFLACFSFLFLFSFNQYLLDM